MTKETNRGKTPIGKAEQRAAGKKTAASVDGIDRPGPVDADSPEEEVQSVESDVSETGRAEGAGEGRPEVEDLLTRNEELLDSLVRLKAEFENYRKRMIKEQTRILETAESGLVKKLLPVIDNLERALENAPDGKATSGLRQGVAMVLEQLIDLLVKEGLEIIDPEGEPFDPEHHEAMMVIETDECPEDTVLDVVQKGYRLNGMLLRPAMVRVSCPVKG